MTPARWDGRPALGITIHDVAPPTQAACERLIRQIESIAPLPLTLLVVPLYHGAPPNSRFEAWLDGRAGAGDELALHGLTHRDDAGRARGPLERLKRHCYTDREGEFAALDAAEAGERMRAGARWFERHGWPLRGFVAPAYLLSRGSWAALREQRFHYTCTLARIVALDRPEPLALDAFGHLFSTRAAWRRGVSRLWNRALARMQRDAPLIRIELHPGDAAYPALLRIAGDLIERALEDGHEPLTLARAAARLRPVGPMPSAR